MFTRSKTTVWFFAPGFLRCSSYCAMTGNVMIERKFRLVAGCSDFYIGCAFNEACVSQCILDGVFEYKHEIVKRHVMF